MFVPVVMDTMISSAFPLSVVDYVTKTVNRVKYLLKKKKDYTAHNSLLI